MSAAIDKVLEHAQGLGLSRTGKGRWRCICPVCGEKNRSTLSLMETDDGTVLMKCFKSECGIDAICQGLGLDVGDLFPVRLAASQSTRRRLLSAAQALELLEHEATVLVVVAARMVKGLTVGPDDLQRLLKAAGRIAYLRQEASQ